MNKVRKPKTTIKRQKGFQARLPQKASLAECGITAMMKEVAGCLGPDRAWL